MRTMKKPIARAKSRSGREPIPFTDENGQAALRVPLDDHGRNHAIVTPEGWRLVREVAGITGAWVLNDNGAGQRYVRCNVPLGDGRRSLLQVARVITGAGSGTAIRYFNGDRLDLREVNLVWSKGKATADSRKVVECGGRAAPSLVPSVTKRAVAGFHESREGYAHA